MSSYQSLIAIIPARGGSKRLPRKNVLPFFGHPMIAYTIEAARQSGLFDRIVVSTDDPEIGCIAEWYGADYLPRPDTLATDGASLVDVALHAIEQIAADGVSATAVCQLMPNCPLRRGSDIRDHYQRFREGCRSFQISVVPFRGLYPHWALTADEEDHGKWVFGSKYLVPSQLLGRPLCPTGAIWWVSVAAFVKQRAFYGTPFHIAPIDANRGIDIDTHEELKLAEVLVHGLTSVDGKSPLEDISIPPFTEGVSK